MGQGFYLGKQVDPKTGKLGDRIGLDPADLLTHGLIVGMTGSGKTGLAIALLEEALRQGIPVIAVDPKGDLGNLLLLFEKLDAESFEPWIDSEAARRDGKDVKTAAADAATAWRQGLGQWGLSGEDIAVLVKSHEAAIYTPGSKAGVALNVLESLEAPSVPFDSAEDDLRDEIAGIVAGILGLLKIDADPLQSQESIFLSNLIEHGWRAGKGFDLETLIAAVADPPFEKIGALPVESVFPGKERQRLMMALNNLLAAPSFQAWREGEPFDVARMLRAGDGRPRLSVLYTAHLSDEERLFVTAMLLDKVKTWMRRQPGTTELRALVYMDEIFGYFPPHPANPPTKRPLLTLLKQARAQGVGVVLATQNPVDLDYKGLANIGTWMVGTLQTEQDRRRLQEGLTGANVKPAEVDRLLDATKKRVFLLHDVHRKGPCLLNSRWAMSYLRGPLTREEISRLMKGRAGAPAAAKPAAAGSAASAPPLLPAPLKNNYLPKYGGEVADACVFVKYAVRYKGADESIGLKAWALATSSALESLETEALEVAEADLQSSAPSGLRYGDLPPWLVPDGAKALERALKDRLPDKLAVSLYADPVTREKSRPGETREAFAARLQVVDSGPEAEKLRDRLEKKKRDLSIRDQEVTGRKTEKWMAIGLAVLKLGQTLTFRKNPLGVSQAERVLTRQRMQDTAKGRADALRAEVAELEQELQGLGSVDPARFQEEKAVPARTGVKVLRYDVLWVY